MIYLSAVPFERLGFPTLDSTPYPAFSKTALAAVPPAVMAIGALLGATYAGLASVTVDGEGGLRTDYCKWCRAYLKTYSGQGSETVPLADWTSLHRARSRSETKGRVLVCARTALHP